MPATSVGLGRALRSLAGLVAILVVSQSLARGAETAAAPEKYLRFQIWTADSVAIYGLYYPAPASDAPVSILLHQPGSEGGVYRPLARQLQAAGLPVIVPDLRGEGRSIESQTGIIPPAPHWSARERPLLHRDLDALLAFARQQPVLLNRSLVVVAEGEAVSLALEFARREPSVRKLVLLSPLILEEEPLPECPPDRGYLALACEGDSLAVASLRRLYPSLPPLSRQMDLLPCRSRGARMLRWQQPLGHRILAWIQDQGADSPVDSSSVK